MPTLKSRLQQIISTRLWEYLMFTLSIGSFIPLLVGEQLPAMQIFFELTHELTQGSKKISTTDRSSTIISVLAALFIEVFCKLYSDWRWFFYDIWNFYDLTCVVLNSPVKKRIDFFENLHPPL